MTRCRTGPAAMLATLLFVAGAIVVPALHLAFHTLPHDHDGGAIHYHERGSADDHDGDHHRGGSHRHAPSDSHHGDRSGAHFSVAIGDDVVRSPVSSAFGFLELGRVVEQDVVRVATALRSVHRLRGPPAGE